MNSYTTNSVRRCEFLLMQLRGSFLPLVFLGRLKSMKKGEVNGRRSHCSSKQPFPPSIVKSQLL